MSGQEKNAVRNEKAGDGSRLRRLLRGVQDLGLGVRLALGGDRPPWGRLALTAIGIGLGVAVLLLASSVQNMMQSRDERQDTLEVSWTPMYHTAEPHLERTPLMLVRREGTEFHNEPISGLALQPVRQGAPLPDGIDSFPQPGEVIVSPALRDLLRSPEGELLRPRVPDEIVGVIGKAGLRGPEQLYYYTGTNSLVATGTSVGAVYAGDQPEFSSGLSSQMWMVLAFGVTVLLVPIVVFVASATRLAEAARERRLAALRLVGADGRQVRRIASGEALVGAVLGVVLGWLIFLAGRQAVANIPFLEFSTFVSDVAPVWYFALLVTIGVPVVAVVTARLAMRRTIIEPLGVVRHTRQSERRLGWRIGPMLLGFAGLLLVWNGGGSTADMEVPFLASIVLILVGVPLILPWVVDKLVQSARTRSLTGMLALRRLQLTSGTAARSVSAIAVVLTGVIALQTVLATVQAEETDDAPPPVNAYRFEHDVRVNGVVARWDTGLEVLEAELREIPAVRDIEGVTTATLDMGAGHPRRVMIADCARLRELGVSRECSKGDAFRVLTGDEWPSGRIEPGQRLPVTSPYYGSVGPGGEPGRVVAWQAPERFEPLRVSGEPSVFFDYRRFGVILTPQAAASIPWWARRVMLGFDLAPGASADTLEIVRNTAARNLVSPGVAKLEHEPPEAVSQVFRKIRYGLLLGTAVAFLLIGCGLFVSAAEQIRQRRRPMAVLAAVGVRRRTLGLSALLQNGVPMLAAMAVSTVVGAVLGFLVVAVIGVDLFVFDTFALLWLLAIAVAAVLIVTGLTLPALRKAMHPEGLHTE